MLGYEHPASCGQLLLPTSPVPPGEAPLPFQSPRVPPGSSLLAGSGPGIRREKLSGAAPCALSRGSLGAASTQFLAAPVRLKAH